MHRAQQHKTGEQLLMLKQSHVVYAVKRRLPLPPAGLPLMRVLTAQTASLHEILAGDTLGKHDSLHNIRL